VSTVALDWGDGSAVEQVPVTPSGGTDAWSFSGRQHTYASSGAKTVTVTGLHLGIGSQGITIPVSPNLLGFTVASDAGTPLSITVNRPAEATNNCVLYAFIRAQVVGTVDFTSPAWVRVGPLFSPNDTQRAIGWYMHPITDLAGEPSSYTFTHANGGRTIAGIVAVAGTDGVIAGNSPTYSGTGVTTGTPQNRDTAAYPVSRIHALQLFGVAAEHSAPNSDAPVSTPAGFTEVIRAVTAGGTTVSRTSIWVGQRVSDSPASVASYSTAGQSMAAESIALGPRTPARLFANVTAMKAKTGFTWAHRGNSHFYAEESINAYRQSDIRGYACLELSMERTSDGVWVAIHDRDPNRTSGLTAGTQPNVAAMTWAQLSALQNTISVDNYDRPYARATDVIAEFGSTHIMILDPKYTWIDSLAYRDEFWALADMVGTSRAIIKFFIDTAGIATAAQSRGYQSWGYAYEATLSDPNWATWVAAPWTMLGMEVGAAQASWDTIKGYGKPVIGHIALSQADYATAITKGAAGVQVGATELVTAVNALS
jgi:hypothetical protein